MTLVSQGGGSLEVVTAGTPTRKSLTLVSTQPARVEAIEETPIHSKLAAYVGEILVDFGDDVAKDQPLVKLVAPELEAELAQKNALHEQAKAEQAQAQSGLKSAEAAIVTARSQVTAAEARIEKTKADEAFWALKCQRFKDLAAGGSVNQQLVEETEQGCSAAKAAHKEALAGVESAKAVVAQSEAEAAKSVADVEAAKSRVLVAAANVAHVEALRSYLTIKAPFDGIVTSRNIDPGHFVQPAAASGTPLMVVARSDKMRVFVAIPEMDAGHVGVGSEATIEVQSLRGAEFKGQVSRTSFALDVGSRSLDALIDIDNTDGRLRPGMYATAKLTLAERPDVLTLPSAAVVRQGKEAFCYRLADGKAVKTPLQLGIKVGDDFEIAGGVSEQDVVILSKAASLKDGQPVETPKP
jgi:RND family efflux transporter MFP subunit